MYYIIFILVKGLQIWDFLTFFFDFVSLKMYFLFFSAIIQFNLPWEYCSLC